MPEVAEHVRQNQPRYLTLLLISAPGHLRLVPYKHCPICVSSAVNQSVLVWLITQDSTVKTMITQSSTVKTIADITCQTSGAFVKSKHRILQKAVDCYLTLPNCSMTQRDQTLREIEICRCSISFLFVGINSADSFQDATSSIKHHDSLEFVFICLIFMRTFYVERWALKVPIEWRKSRTGNGSISGWSIITNQSSLS